MNNGDKEFENFLNQDNGGEDNINPSCHQRLMLDAISNRADIINNMYNATTEFLLNSIKSEGKALVPIDVQTIRNAEEFMIYLMKEAKTTIHQSDYLISRILDAYENEDEEDEGDDSKSKP